MPPLLFYFFAMITLAFGLLVIVLRNPVGSAMSLVVSFAGLAALFVSLDAYFIGTIQILVYAGAVMVLFLFIIMLLDIKSEEEKSPKVSAIAGGLLLAALFIFQTVTLVNGYPAGKAKLADTPLKPGLAAETAVLPTIKNDLRPLAAGVKPTLPDAKLMGETLFTKYPFHLQVIGLLLLVGTVGVVVLSRREKGEPT